MTAPGLFSGHERSAGLPLSRSSGAVKSRQALQSILAPRCILMMAACVIMACPLAAAKADEEEKAEGMPHAAAAWAGGARHLGPLSAAEGSSSGAVAQVSEHHSTPMADPSRSCHHALAAVQGKLRTQRGTCWLQCHDLLPACAERRPPQWAGCPVYCVQRVGP